MWLLAAWGVLLALSSHVSHLEYSDAQHQSAVALQDGVNRLCMI